MDSVSVTNGIIVTRAKRRPLMIDPQLQGTKWIKKRFDGTEFHIVRMNDSQRIANMLEFSIKQGHPLLIEDMPETIDPLLEPIVMN
jgi:dynein heavy chain, axonemal